MESDWVSSRYTPQIKIWKPTELRRAVKFEYIRHPPWILGLHRYILNAKRYSKNGAVYITRIISSIVVTKRRTSQTIAVNVFLRLWSLAVCGGTDTIVWYTVSVTIGSRKQRNATHREDSLWNFLHLDVHSRYVLRMRVGWRWSQVHAGWWYCLQSPHNKLCQLQRNHCRVDSPSRR